MKAAPIGAFGAMAFTIGKFGPAALGNLIGLIAMFYLTAALFVFVVLGLIARIVGFKIFKFLAYIKDELLIVLGTSSSESALPQLMEKLERLGCSKSVVGLVVPTGYSFNLDGTNIYMTLATLFIAQALGFDLDLRPATHHPAGRDADLEGRQRRHRRRLHHAGGDAAGGQSGAGAGHGDRVLGIDKFMSECRALTNITGNGVADGVRVVVGGRTRSRQAARRPEHARSIRPMSRPRSPRDNGALGTHAAKKKPPGFAGRFFVSALGSGLLAAAEAPRPPAGLARLRRRSVVGCGRRAASRRGRAAPAPAALG